jgi:hypothetical protein
MVERRSGVHFGVVVCENLDMFSEVLTDKDYRTHPADQKCKIWLGLAEEVDLVEDSLRNCSHVAAEDGYETSTPPEGTHNPFGL